jgi:hypothetical protein
MEHEPNSSGTDCSADCPGCHRVIENERKQLRDAVRRIHDAVPRMAETERTEAAHEIEKLEQRYEFISDPGWPQRVWPDREPTMEPYRPKEPTIIPWL